ncbi:MAG: hypothetical protein ACI9TK_001389, partial [Flavobacteriaceae bacterium]
MVFNFNFFGINVKDIALRHPGVPLNVCIARLKSYS